MTEKSDPVEALRADAEHIILAERQCSVCDGDGIKESGANCGGCGATGSVHVYPENVRRVARAFLDSPAAEAAGMVMVRGIRLYTEPSSEAGQFVIVEASGVEVIRAFGALPDIVIDHYVTPVGISAAMIEAASLRSEPSSRMQAEPALEKDKT